MGSFALIREVSLISNAVDFSWRLPWALAVIGVGCNLLLIPFYAVITGSGDVASINRREMMGGMAGSVIGWLVIACGGSSKSRLS